MERLNRGRWQSPVRANFNYILFEMNGKECETSFGRHSVVNSIIRETQGGGRVVGERCIVMAQATPMFEMKMKEEKNLLLACIINNDIRPSRVHIKYY